jgi:hypothetical protein
VPSPDESLASLQQSAFATTEQLQAETSAAVQTMSESLASLADGGEEFLCSVGPHVEDSGEKTPPFGGSASRRRLGSPGHDGGKKGHGEQGAAIEVPGQFEARSGEVEMRHR